MFTPFAILPLLVIQTQSEELKAATSAIFLSAQTQRNDKEENQQRLREENTKEER